MSHASDLNLWAKEQAELLRAAGMSGTNQPIDWSNVAEEIEDLGNSQRDRLESYISTIIEHLLKLQHSPAIDPRAGWLATVLRTRNDVRRVLKRNPSLKPDVGPIISDMMADTATLVIRLLEIYGEIDGDRAEHIRSTSYDETMILGDWLP